MKQREIVDQDAEISRDEEVECLANEPVEEKAYSNKVETVYYVEEPIIVEENGNFLEEIKITKK